MTKEERFRQKAVKIIHNNAIAEYTFERLVDVDYNAEIGEVTGTPDRETALAVKYDIVEEQLKRSVQETKTVIAVAGFDLNFKKFKTGDKIYNDTEKFVIVKVRTDQYKAAFFFEVVYDGY